jgi:tetratricopeptide (TPR) repeat protein
MPDEFDEIHSLLQQKEYDLALHKLLTKAHRLRARFCTDQNHSWYLVGSAFYKMNDLRRALSAYQKALEAWPGDVEAMWALANCHSERGHPEQAAKILKRAIVLAPRNQALKYNYANALFDLGQYEQAIKLYQQLLRSKRVGKAAGRNLALARRRLST